MFYGTLNQNIVGVTLILFKRGKMEVQPQDHKLTKKEKRLLRKETGDKDRLKTNNLILKQVQPLTENQRRTFDNFNQGYNLLLHGIAGTGKSYCAIYLALKEILNKHSYENLTIVRSVVPTRDMGFLPGNQKEKAMAYEGPYYPIVNSLFGRGDAYQILKQKNVINFMTTSFIRGITIDDSVIVVDEMQNMSWGELDSIITRVGNNCRIIFCGDFRQTDFIKDSEKEGLKRFMNVLDRMRDFAYIEFVEDDIVRSALVKDYIIAKTRVGY